MSCVVRRNGVVMKYDVICYLALPFSPHRQIPATPVVKSQGQREIDVGACAEGKSDVITS